MPIVRVRIADTEAVAKYIITKKGTKIERITTLNYFRGNGRWSGRRNINLLPEQQDLLVSLLCIDLGDKLVFPDRYNSKYTRV